MFLNRLAVGSLAAVALFTVTVKFVPLLLGTKLAGLDEHVAGGVPVQEMLTVLLYPLNAVSVPLRFSAWFTVVLCDPALAVCEKSGLPVTTKAMG